MSASTECIQTSLKSNNCKSRKLNQFISIHLIHLLFQLIIFACFVYAASIRNVGICFQYNIRSIRIAFLSLLFDFLNVVIGNFVHSFYSLHMTCARLWCCNQQNSNHNQTTSLDGRSHFTPMLAYPKWLFPMTIPFTMGIPHTSSCVFTNCPMCEKY